MIRVGSICVLLLVQSFTGAQQSFLRGVVLDSLTENPIDVVTVYIDEGGVNTETGPAGSFELMLSVQDFDTIHFSRLGYHPKEIAKSDLGDWLNLRVLLAPSESDLGVTVTEERLEASEMIRESPADLILLPSATGNLESVLPHIALGVRSGTGGELSSQYNVRGGNYDENLVYVNDFEIFRPQLLRNSQQEGLSFPNIDLIRDLSFSSGGFQSKYGDKMSSVLDIRYKRPERFAGSASGSLLGGSLHLEGSTSTGDDEARKLRYLFGARYKTTKYLLGSLDVQGEYAPNFSDIQGYLTYDVSRDLQLGAIANYNQSTYDFIPKSRATALGLIDFALMLTSVFQGAETDEFKTGLLGASLTYLPERQRNPLFVKLLVSSYRGMEKEHFDITGFYRLSQVESDIGSENVGEEVAVLGLGTQQQFARNRLFSEISNVQVKGGIEFQIGDLQDHAHFIQWGVKWQREEFDDRLNEWERIDSAGYSLPYSQTRVLLNEVLKSSNVIVSDKLTAYLQNTYTAINTGISEWRITLGTRFSHWTLNNATFLSPRLEMLYKPLSWNKDLSFKLAGGMYYQTPLYRELRRPDGSLNAMVQPQRSFQVIAGMTSDFEWRRLSDSPFRLIVEAYYKSFSELITFDINNVRIRYSGQNDASGHAMGLDVRLNGEFVPGAESWINLSFLRTRESLDGVEHLRIDPSTGIMSRVSDVPRPTDSFFNLSVFFQDYLPQNERFKVNLNMTFGTGLPFGIPGNNTAFRNVFRYKAYRRVDMGFSYQLVASVPGETANRLIDNAWLSLEVFNLIGIENVSSNTWIKTIFDQQFAVPNNLTNRRVNLRLRVEF